MKKFLLSIILFATKSYLLFAQQQTFSKVLYDSLQEGVQASAIAKSFDGGYMIAGIHNYGSGGLITKIDSTGNILWNKFYVNPALNLNCIVPTKDSCFFIAGNIRDTITQAQNALLIKLKANGDTLWSKTIGETGHSFNVMSAQQTFDLGYIITGYAEVPGPPYSKLFVSKISAMGNLVWSSLFRPNGNSDSYGYSVKQTNDSGYVVMGTTTSGTLLIKLSKSGSLSWAKTYASNTYGFGPARDFVITNNGLLLYTTNNNGLALVKTDLSGNVVWGVSYNVYVYTINTYNVVPPKLHQDATEGGYVFIDGSCVGGNILRVDSTGSIIWSRSVILNGMDIVPVADGGYFILGNGPLCGIRSSIPFTAQIGIIKTDSLGGDSMRCIYSQGVSGINDMYVSTPVTLIDTTGRFQKHINFSILPFAMATENGCVLWLGNVNEVIDNYHIVFYPNPTSGQLTIESLTASKKDISIIDLSGKIVKRLFSKAIETTIDVGDMNDGLYFVRVTGPEGTQTAKLVIQH